MSELSCPFKGPVLSLVLNTPAAKVKGVRRNSTSPDPRTGGGVVGR